MCLRSITALKTDRDCIKLIKMMNVNLKIWFQCKRSNGGKQWAWGPSRPSCMVYYSDSLSLSFNPSHIPQTVRGFLEDIHTQLNLDTSFIFHFPPAASFFSTHETLHRMIILHVGERVCTWELETGHITSLPHYTAMLAWECFQWTDSVFPWHCMSEIREWGKIQTQMDVLSFHLLVSVSLSSLQIAERNLRGSADNRSV